MLDQPTALLATLTAVQPNVTVIYNPTSGRRRGRKLQQFVDAARLAGLEVVIQKTHRPGDAEHLAALTTSDGWTDTLVVAGGDGTINEVINGLAAGLAPPLLALLPLGTANVLAAEIGMASSPVALVDEIIRATRNPGRCSHMCVARANGRRFAMMAGIGFDAHVVGAVGERMKRLTGKAAYLAAFARILVSFGRRRYNVLIDGTAYEAASVIVANGHFYGGRFCCAPGARVSEAELHVCLFLRGGRLNVLSYGASLIAGRLHQRNDVRIVRGRQIEVRGATGDPVHCDGDLVTSLPLYITASGERLPIVTASR